MVSNVLVIKNNISFIVYNARRKEIKIGSCRGILTTINQSYNDYKKTIDKLNEFGYALCSNRTEINIDEVVKEKVDFIECVLVFKESIISINYVCTQKKICINTVGGCLVFNNMTEEKYEEICRSILEDEFIKIDIFFDNEIDLPDFGKIDKLN